MIFRTPSPMSHVPRPLSWLLCTLLLVTHGALAEAPAWWQTRGVLKTNATPNDYAALNVGQLKQLAFSAWQELETLPGGAGFQPIFTNAANNYAAVNVGQLKAVAQPCYDRLIGIGLATNYPWSNSSATNNFTIANIGQAKNSFSFFLDQTLDTDGDSMPNIWESGYGFDWSVWQTDGIHGPGDDADGDGLVNTQELAYATSPVRPDTDFDGLSDFEEFRAGTDPRSQDTDKDGLSDLAELRSTQIMAWGTNDYGQCTAPDSVTNVIAVAGGSRFSLALRSDRTIVNWGQNISIPSSATNVAAIAGGYMHGLALRRDGKVIAWGYNNYGQAIVPVTLPAAVAIAAGSLHSVALCSDGRVVAWGDNTYGQRNVPTSANPSVGLSAGLFHNLALRADGTVVAWGGTGFLNHGQTNVPASAINVVAIAGGGYHSLALRADGTVLAWGDNTYGQCSVPASASNIVAIAAGQFHSFALCRDGKVVAWGDNDGGECAGASNVISGASIASGWHHGLVIPYRTDPLKKDTDGDNIPDGWEISHGLDPRNSTDASQDADNDGLSNYNEYLNNIHPYNQDSDGDTYSDGWEVANGFDPTDAFDTGSDSDGDGLTNVEEYFLGTNPVAFDTDADGLSDDTETIVQLLTLWDENGDRGVCYLDIMVAQVTASDTARAARLKDGQVIIFTGSCTNMLAYTNDCGAAKIDATESWIAAVLTNGNVKIWREVNGGLSEFSLGSTNAIDISGGYQHLLVLYKNGSVTCLKKDGSGAPVTFVNSLCSVVGTNALFISAGTLADAVIQKNRMVVFGDVFSTYGVSASGIAFSNRVPLVVSSGENYSFVVHFTNGSANAYQPISSYVSGSTMFFRYDGALIPRDVVSIAAGGSSNMIAVLSSGINATITRGVTNWNTTALTNRLTDANDLWWRRGSSLAVTHAGELLPLAASSVSGRKLGYRMAAITPGGAARGIAAACLGTSATKNDSDGDGMSDGWEFYGGIDPLNATGVNGQQGDPDGDGLSNFDEYINGTSPTKEDTDDDGVKDKIEVDQGSNPCDKSDNGLPPPASELVDVPFSVGDPSGSHSERWQMNIKSLGPTDKRAFFFVNEEFGTVGTKNFKLRKGNSYEINLQHQATQSGYTTDYDWQAQVGGLPSASVLESGKTHPTATRYSSRSDLNILIDNEDGLLGTVNSSFDATNHAVNKKAKLHILKIEMAMDGNRDGIIEFDKPEDRQAIFWVNNDYDVKQYNEDMWQEDDLETGTPNCDDDTIGRGISSITRSTVMGTIYHNTDNNCLRDLEDFTRLHVRIGALPAGMPTNDITCWVKFENVVEGDLRVKLFKALKSDQSYLKNKDDATDQVKEKSLTPFSVCEEADMQIDMKHIKLNNEISAFLLEGCLEGSGKLTIMLKKAGHEIVKTSVWINLLNITHFYNIYEVKHDFTSRSNPTQGVLASEVQKAGYTPVTDEEFLLVHGWNMDVWEKRRWIETAFKRLWWQGYKGRVSSFEWPTLTGFGLSSTFPLQHFDESEYRSWLSGQALANLIQTLNGKGQLRVVAHSMGNVVAGEAIRNLPPEVPKVKTYIACQAAISAQYYHDVSSLYPNRHRGFDWTFPNTPDVIGKYLSGKPYLSISDDETLRTNDNVSKWVNYYNYNDWALNHWSYNNVFKPDSWGWFNYAYTGRTEVYEEGTDWFWRNFTILRLGTKMDRFQIFSYIVESRSCALGQVFLGKFNNWNLEVEQGYDDRHYSHSREFRSNIIDEEKFWNKIFKDCSFFKEGIE